MRKARHLTGNIIDKLLALAEDWRTVHREDDITYIARDEVFRLLKIIFDGQALCLAKDSELILSFFRDPSSNEPLATIATFDEVDPQEANRQHWQQNHIYELLNGYLDEYGAGGYFQLIRDVVKTVRTNMSKNKEEA